MSNEVALIEVKNPLEVFTVPNGLDAIIDKIEADVKSIDRDISTEAGRDNIRSVAFKLAKSKKEIERMALSLTDGWRAQTKNVNAERDRGVERMQKLQDEIRKPLTDWEEAEEKRVADHEAAIAAMAALHPRDLQVPSSEVIQQRISDLGNMPVRNWQEFDARAAFTRKETAEALLKALQDAQKREAEAAELARLREEEAARKQKERDDQIAAEAAAKAKKEAEEKAAAEAAAAAAKAEEERLRLEAEKKAAAEREEKERQEKIAAQQRAEKAEADAKAAAEKAALDKVLAEALAKAEQEKAVEAAAQKERDRQAAEKAAEEKAAAARAADQAHKAKVNNEALAALLLAAEKVDPAERNITTITKALLIAIAKGEIPSVSIKY